MATPITTYPAPPAQPLPDQPSPAEQQYDHLPDTEPQKPRSKRGFWLTVVGVLLIFGVLLLLGLLPRLKHNKEQKQEAQTEADAVPAVSVVPAKVAPDTVRLDLPADTRSNRETFVFAQTNGYVQAWYADIGARVKRGQLLAIIATPELDQQIAQARANLTLARSSYDRLRNISMPGAISQQELDQGRAGYASQQAVVNGLLAQQAFRRVTAPFSGIVTQRGIEVGSLVSTSNADGSQLFKIEQTDTLRAFVNVPQNYVPGIRTGLPAQVIVPEFPDRTFAGRVSRNAGALAEGTRTLLTEVKVPNKQQLLKPGIFTQVRFELPRTARSIIIPANTLVASGEQPRVVVIQDKKVHYQNIVQGRDFGAEVEITQGLNGGEMLVVNPAETLEEGETIAAKQAKPAKKPEGANKPKPAGPLYDPNRPTVSSPVAE